MKEEIRNWIKKHDLTRAHAAKILDISENTLNNWLSKRKIPDYKIPKIKEKMLSMKEIESTAFERIHFGDDKVTISLDLGKMPNIQLLSKWMDLSATDAARFSISTFCSILRRKNVEKIGYQTNGTTKFSLRVIK